MTYSLDHKYTRTSGSVFLTGSQALVRLLLVQQQRDAMQGLNTAGFVSGYRGSPLGIFDQQLWKAGQYLKAHHIHFQPGINEDLAATAIWGSQQVGFFDGARYDGVFSLWYGKGPGADRSGDAFKHANSAGAATHGGVLAVVGDDHGCKSSSLAFQSEYAFVDASIPVLHPAGLQELLDYGILGWAMSRYSGCWTGIKVTADLIESSGVIDADIGRVDIRLPTDFDMPEGGLGARWPDPALEQEYRLQEQKLPAALAFIRANGLNRVTVTAARPRLGIVTTGKSYLDVRQALCDLGIDAQMVDQTGLAVYKVGVPWPLEPAGVRAFADGLEEILVVEEKRPLIENQLKGSLYGVFSNGGPRIIGKLDESGKPLLPVTGELSTAMIARAIAARIDRMGHYPVLDRRIEFLARQEAVLDSLTTSIERTPYFCSGCPHNISTRVPDGSRALAGIGCHTMAVWRDSTTMTLTHMGGEGVTWIGLSPFTDIPHVFQNLGDGTYFHSGLLAIRAAVSAGVNITYKILFNDAVAMTGGQPVDGALTPALITRQVFGEGVRRIAVVSDAPEKYSGADQFAAGVTIHHRREMDRLQRELRETAGVSVLVYDQLCAAEKRRRRRRGTVPAAPRRVFINELVCEGCGDCSAVSSCLAITPLETGFGRKRVINQSVCNMDYSCVDGLCPSFVTVEGGRMKKPDVKPMPLPDLPEPQPVAGDGVYSILITGIGGTGVVTVAALLGTAAHLEGKNVRVLDQTGLAQKFGAVMSHVRIAAGSDEIHTARIPAGAADLLLGCDLVVAAGKGALVKLDPQRSRTVLDTYEEMTSGFLTSNDFKLPGCGLRDAIRRNTAPGQLHEINATSLANRLLGNTIGANVLLLGFAWQQGLVPLRESSILRAIELNGVAVEQNKQAFASGRQAAGDPEGLRTLLAGISNGDEPVRDLEAIINLRVAELGKYQNETYAGRYEQAVREVARIESECIDTPARPVTESVARNYFRLLAYKDEYEVARLHSSTSFLNKLRNQLSGDYRIQLHLSPPLLARTDPDNGRPQKIIFGEWVVPWLKVLARFRFLRGTWLDPFSYGKERRAERQLIADYEETMETIVRQMNVANHSLAIELASWPKDIRGFGPVKAAAIARAAKRREELLGEWRQPRQGSAAEGQDILSLAKA